MRLDEWQKYIESEFLEDKISSQTAVAVVKEASTALGDEKSPLISDQTVAHALKEEAQETPSMRLKRRRNLTSANVVTHFEIPTYPVGESGRSEPIYALLRSQPPEKESTDGEIKADEYQLPALESDISTAYEIKAVTSSHTAALSPGNSVNEALRSRSVKNSEKANLSGLASESPIKPVSQMPSLDQYLPGMPSLLNEEDADGNMNDFAVVNPRSYPSANSVQGALSLASASANDPAKADFSETLKVLQVINRISNEDSLRPVSAKTLSGNRLLALEGLLNPELTLEQTALLLDISVTTVRRYTNQGILKHFRKGMEGVDASEMNSFKTRQRRFRLLDVLEFLEERLNK